MQDPSILELTASEPLTLDQEFDMQKKWAEDNDKCTFIILSRVLFEQFQKNEMDSMVGDVNLFLSSEESGAEVEIMIAEKDWRGKGLGKESVALMLRYGIEQLGLRKFRVKIGRRNGESRGMFEKLGFEAVEESEIFDEVTMELGNIEDCRVLAECWKNYD